MAAVGADLVRAAQWRRVLGFAESARTSPAALTVQGEAGADERRAARAAVTRPRLVPVMFELAARPHPPQQVYRAYLAQSHVFIGIYWESYGWVAPGQTRSGLEDAAYFLALAEPAESELRGAGQQAWLNRLELRHDNLSAALSWLLDQDQPGPALELVWATGRFWWLHCSS